MEKFNSQICTTREQSERLLALGLKKETADMHYEMKAEGELPRLMPHASEIDYFQLWDSITPAWSLHRLLSMIEEDFQSDGRFFCLPMFGFDKSDNLYDNIIDAYEWLIKEGYFNKEYLNQHQVVVNEYGKLCSEVEEHCKGVMEYLDYIRKED